MNKLFYIVCVLSCAPILCNSFAARFTGLCESTMFRPSVTHSYIHSWLVVEDDYIGWLSSGGNAKVNWLNEEVFNANVNSCNTLPSSSRGMAALRFNEFFGTSYQTNCEWLKRNYRATLDIRHDQSGDLVT